MKQKITSFQAILLVMSTILPTAILTVPYHVVRFSKQDSWISIVIATIVGVAFASLIASICRQNPEQTFLGWLQGRLGRKLGTCIGILLTYYYFLTAFIILREFTNFLSENVLTRTPSYMLMIVTVGVALYAVSQGIEVIARINLVVVFAALLVFLITAILLAKGVHPRFLFPFWDQPLSVIIQGGILPGSWLSEVAIVLLVAPFLNHPQEAGKVGISGVILAGVVLSVFVVAAVTIYGPNLLTHMSFPTFNMIGIIQVGRFLERVDILFISIWICLMYVKISIFMFGAFHCFVQTFRIRCEKPFLFALGLLAVLSSLYAWPKTPYFNYFITFALAPYLLAFNVILPLFIRLCLCVTNMKRLKGEN
jgi:spore germination protein KB